MITGTFVLQSSKPVQRLHLLGPDSEHGQHVPSRYNGFWWLQHAGAIQHTFYVPSRDKRIHLTCLSDEQTLPTELESMLTTLDSDYEGINQLSKYKRVYDKLLERSHRSPFVAVLNNEGTHGSWGFLTHEVPLYFYGVEDENMVQLLWSTEDLATRIRHANPIRYKLYRLPVLQDGPLFISTQAVCSKWWRWSQQFPEDQLRQFNALEVMLFNRRYE
jgi:hypothetical protein